MGLMFWIHVSTGNNTVLADPESMAPAADFCDLDVNQVYLNCRLEGAG